MKKLILAIAFILAASPAFAVKPNPALTPGELCTPTNPDFIEYRYQEHIAYCKRNVTRAMKLQIAQAYGIPETEWHNYEFDHFVPLNAGGDSSVKNVWPQPLAEAKDKDKVEQKTYDGLNDGTLTQKEAVQMIVDWINQH